MLSRREIMQAALAASASTTAPAHAIQERHQADPGYAVVRLLSHNGDIVDSLSVHEDDVGEIDMRFKLRNLKKPTMINTIAVYFPDGRVFTKTLGSAGRTVMPGESYYARPSV